MGSNPTHGTNINDLKFNKIMKQNKSNLNINWYNWILLIFCIIFFSLDFIIFNSNCKDLIAWTVGIIINMFFIIINNQQQIYKEIKNQNKETFIN